MTLFGKSLFETVLTTLDENRPVDDAPASLRVRGFNTGFIGAQGWTVREEDALDPALWFDAFPPDPVVPDEQPPEWIARLSEEDVARDLDLAACREIRQLRAIRRSFALDSHPDRVAPCYRQEATTRMMIANRLIDQHMQVLREGGAIEN